VPRLREALITAQSALRDADFPVIVLFGGVDGAGKGDVVNALNAWMDPRWMVTRAFDEPSDEELERPEYWRFWRALPPKGQIGLLLSAWYSRPLLERARGGGEAQFEQSLESIVGLEQQLADDGACIVKFWLHLSVDEQEARFRRLEADPLLAWRVTESDWENWKRYDQFVAAAERIIGRTSTGLAPWHIVEGFDPSYASLQIGETLHHAIETRLAEKVIAVPGTGVLVASSPSTQASPASVDDQVPSGVEVDQPTVLSNLDMSKCLEKSDYKEKLAVYQRRLNQLQKIARDKGTSTILVFEGWDASGKGGTIRRINAALDARAVQVIPIAAPTDEERAQHYLWRFWRHLSRAGRVTIFDRSWYGRVLVERVEALATEQEWRRAYVEINRFEQQLVDHGIVLLKFWMNLTKEEQLARFEVRQSTSYKRWKLTDEDWRNRARWDDYELAVHDMVQRTSTTFAPWNLVEANDKHYARVKVLEEICSALGAALGSPPGQVTRREDSARGDEGHGKGSGDSKKKKKSRSGKKRKKRKVTSNGKKGAGKEAA
jgi:polyphosphate:AMP phosphotransferase